MLVKPRLVIALGALANAAPSPATLSAGRKIAAGRQGDEYQPLIPGGAAPARMVHEAWIGAGSVTFASADCRRLSSSLAVPQPTERLLARALEAACHHRLLELDFARAHKAVKDCRFTKRLSPPEDNEQ